MKVIWVAGARPNFMKVAPIWRAMEAYDATASAGRPRFEPLLVHTGQHYDANMSDVFFRDLALPEPHEFLEVGSGTHGEQVARVLTAFEKLLEQVRPDMVGVVGDVNSTAACALATAKSYVLEQGRTPRLVHVEAGLRSGDRRMPEEINRIVTDSLSDILFTSEESGNSNLLREGVAPEKIHFVGNVMVDSLKWALSKTKGGAAPVVHSQESGSQPTGPYVLVTLHRPSNVDDLMMLRKIMAALQEIGEHLPVIFPVHPRTASRIQAMGVTAEPSASSRLKKPGLHFMPPLGYDDFLALMVDALVVITDSGGIQEETTALGVPCLTLRENTERPVTISEGTNILINRDPERLIVEVDNILQGPAKRCSVPLLWDGHAAERIVEVLSRCGEDRKPADAENSISMNERGGIARP